MPRRREIPKREVLPDPLYNSQLVTKFVNVVMRDGKKSVAERILYDALEAIRTKTSDDPMKVFKKAIENVKPAAKRPRAPAWRASSWTPPRTAAARSRRRKTRTGWPRPTRRLPIIAGSP